MNIKEILKINFSNSEYLMERNIDSSLEQDKNWINLINIIDNIGMLPLNLLIQKLKKIFNIMF